MHNRRDNKYYMVRNTTGSGGCVEIASGIVPVTSPTLFTSGAATEGTYKLFRGAEGVQAPTGASVTELTKEEAGLAVDGDLFTGAQPSVDFIALEQATAQVLRQSFMAAQAALRMTAKGVATRRGA